MVTYWALTYPFCPSRSTSIHWPSSLTPVPVSLIAYLGALDDICLICCYTVCTDIRLIVCIICNIFLYDLDAACCLRGLRHRCCCHSRCRCCCRCGRCSRGWGCFITVTVESSPPVLYPQPDATRVRPASAISNLDFFIRIFLLYSIPP